MYGFCPLRRRTFPLQQQCYPSTSVRGEFKKRIGQKVERVGFFTNGSWLKPCKWAFTKFQFSVEPRAIYLSHSCRRRTAKVLQQLGKQHSAVLLSSSRILIILPKAPSAFNQIITFLAEHNAKPGRPLFTRCTFKINLPKPKRNCSPIYRKTRCNVLTRNQKGVEVVEKYDSRRHATVCQNPSETTKRQGFMLIHQNIFRRCGNQWVVMLRIFEAKYEGTCIASWVMFLLNDRLYYPWGIDWRPSRGYGEQSNAVGDDSFWQNPKLQGVWSLQRCTRTKWEKSHPWYGFHRFKAGYGGTLMEYLGSFWPCSATNAVPAL